MLLDSFKQILYAAVQDPDFVRKNSMFCNSDLLAQTVQRIGEITGQLFFIEDWATVLTADGNAVVDSAEGRVRVTQSVLPVISTVTFKPRLWQLPPRLQLWLVIPEAGQLDPSEYTVEYTLLPPAPVPPTWLPTWTAFRQCDVVPLPTYGIQFRAVITNPINPIEYLPKLIFFGATA
jgi:hypothetical protein